MPPPAANPLKLARQWAGRMRRRVREWVRGESTDTYFDLHDLHAVNAILGPHAAPLTFDPALANAGIAGASRYILALLAKWPVLRTQFPTALSGGADWPFAHWVADNATTLGLTPTGIANIRAAFASNPGERGKRVYEFREDLRLIFPFGMTPHPDRGKLLLWLITHGASDLGLSPEESLWFLFDRDEAPDRGLVSTYLVRADWQERFPHALTEFGWPEFKRFLAREYGLRGRWFRNAELPPQYRPWDDLTLLRRAKPQLNETFPAPPTWDTVRSWGNLPQSSLAWREGLRRDFLDGMPTQAGVNVLGHFRYASGLQESALGVIDGLTRVGIRTTKRDLPVNMPTDGRDRDVYQGVELFDTTLYVAAVNTFPHKWYPRCGLFKRPGVRRIAVWYWELEDMPAEWVPDLTWADEVWAPSRFVAEAFRKSLRVPVVPMLPGVELPPFTPQPRSYFNLPDDRFVFLFTFDMGSVMERKNPLGLIRAFREAFRPDDRAHLVVKVSRGSSDPASFAKLQAAARDSGVTLIDRVMTRADTLALFATADCYASLHRSEGLGLGMAESMLMGKPVIATGYSGNLDFMTPDVSHLVEHRRVPITENFPPYPIGSYWAEPSVEHAAALMRRVYETPDESRQLGARARATLTELLSVNAAGHRMIDRLAAITHVSERAAA